MKKVIALAALGFGLAACSDAPVGPTPAVPTAAGLTRAATGSPIAGQYIVRFRDDEQNVDGQANNIASKHAGKITHLYKSALRGMSIQLSEDDDYAGGDLEFCPHGVIGEFRGIGNVVAFPAYIAHRVLPVLSGQREALVAWIHGPSYR